MMVAGSGSASNQPRKRLASSTDVQAGYFPQQWDDLSSHEFAGVLEPVVDALGVEVTYAYGRYSNADKVGI